MSDPNAHRYSRQVLLEQIGDDGQRLLQGARATIVGCGALGSFLSELLCRSGVGQLRIVDRDYLELNNLQRQVLFDEQDVRDGLPKAEAARRKLSTINSDVNIDAIVDDVNPDNIAALVDDCDVVLDGTDNFDTRYLINDVCMQHGIPWVYGACVSTSGLAMAILPGDTACLRCVFEEPPPTDMNPTCDTVGVLSTTVSWVASLQTTECLKILTGRLDEVSRQLFSLDVWCPRMTAIHVTRQDACPCCQQRQFDFLNGRAGHSAVTLCGRDAVQIRQEQKEDLDLNQLASRLGVVSQGSMIHNQFMLQVSIDGFEMTIFPNGRAIIKGTSQPDEARTLYAKYVGA